MYARINRKKTWFFTGFSCDPLEVNLTTPPEQENRKPTYRPKMLAFIRSQRGSPYLVQSGFVYRSERRSCLRTYWLCVQYKTHKCVGRLICQGNDVVKFTPHNHERDESRANYIDVVEYRDLTDPVNEDFLKLIREK